MKNLVLATVATALLAFGTICTATGTDDAKGMVKCKDSTGKVMMTKSADECTKAGGTVEK